MTIRPSSYDVARLAKVNRTTVSMVLNGKGDQKRILAAAGYSVFAPVNPSHSHYGPRPLPPCAAGAEDWREKRAFPANLIHRRRPASHGSSAAARKVAGV